MALTKQEWLALEKKAFELRNLCLDTTYWAGSGHIGGGMSVMDMLTILYHKYLNIKKDDPNSKMGIHLDSNKVVGVDASTGSLGHGLSIALGTALAARVLGKDYKTYCILGDGECDEGSNWEAAMSINAFHATNVISFVDRNKCMIDGRTEDVMPLEPFADKWRAFGFHVFDIDGHNMMELSNAIDYALGEPDAPVMIIANTIKGEGIDFMEDDYHWHYGAVDEAKYKEAKESLKKHYEKRIARVEKEAK